MINPAQNYSNIYYYSLLFGAPEPDFWGSHAYGCVTHRAFNSPSAIPGPPGTLLSELSGGLHWAQLIQWPPHFLDNSKNYIFMSVHTQYTEYTHPLIHTHTYHIHVHTHLHTGIHMQPHIHIYMEAKTHFSK